MKERYNYENYEWIRDHLITLFSWERITKLYSHVCISINDHLTLMEVLSELMINARDISGGGSLCRKTGFRLAKIDLPVPPTD